MENYNETHISTLRNAYREYSELCGDALGFVIPKLESAKRAVEKTFGRNLICSIDSRIKTFESTIEKCKRRGYDISIESIKQNVLDVGGIRIVTPFRDDIFKVVDIIHHIPGINITKEKDYVTNPKANGYSSYHLQCLVEVYLPFSGGTQLVPIEIQIRDKAMDLWATVEHIIYYKNDEDNYETEESEFAQAAEILRRFDGFAIKHRDARFNKKHADDGNGPAVSDTILASPKNPAF